MKAVVFRSILVVAMLSGSITAAAGSSQPLQTVATFGNDFRLVGIGVSHDGRVFASAPASQKRSRYSLVEVDAATGKLTPYPDAAWNRFDAHRSGDSQWVSVQALWVDRANHLWALDSSLSSVDKARLPPKLVEFDLADNRIIRTYQFQQTISDKDSLNDVRVDLKHGYAYVSNAANGGGVVVLNLRSGASRLLLQGDRSSVSDPSQHLMFGQRIARGKSGKIVSLDTDGIALSPDRAWLYYRPLTDHHYYRIATAALIDNTMSAKARAAQVQYLGDHVLSGGIAMSDAGVLYAGDLEHHSVIALTPMKINGKPGLQSSVVVHDARHLAWADGFAIANGNLYIADSHLNETNFSNGYPRSGRFTIFRVPLSRPSASAAGATPND